MSILSRFKDIMSANINALLDKCEDPAKMIDQTLRNLREDLAEIKKETAAVMADEKAAKRKLDDCSAQVTRYQTAAQNAVAAGNDDDARTLIQKKQQLETNLADLRKTYDLAHANANKMRQLHDKLVSDINQLESRKDTIKAKINVAKTQQHINEITSGAQDAADSMAAFDRMEHKADRMLDEAMAGAELNQQPADSAEALADKYGGSGGSVSVEDELAAMKAAMNGNQ